MPRPNRLLFNQGYITYGWNIQPSTLPSLLVHFRLLPLSSYQGISIVRLNAG
jgi:hypothetical protein